MSHESLAKFVERYLAFNTTCRVHCNAPTSLKLLLEEPNHVVGAYLCPGGFVSRVVYFSFNDGTDRFYAFLSRQLGSYTVQRRDLRVATRHGWELGEEAMDELTIGQKVVKEVYWTRYPRTEVEKRRGVFLCGGTEHNVGCGRLFVQEVTSKEMLCPQCR